MVDPVTRGQLLACWRDVSNAGGAVGFPFLPVDDEHVRPGNTSRLTSHWARVLRVQTALKHRGTGVGRMLMVELGRAARDDLGLEQLHLELRAGLGLEAFYRSLGWRVVGTWPGALRLAENDHRDEVLMLLPLR